MKFLRSSGILLHPTSLPGPYGIGDLGPEAYRWIEFLANSGIGLWQILPLGPTGYGDSPYQSFSAFAGNVYLISPDLLIKDGLINSDEKNNFPSFSKKKVDYEKVKKWKDVILKRAFDKFNQKKHSKLATNFRDFISDNAFWLDDFALFMAIKKDQKSHAWNQWPSGLRYRNPSELNKFRKGYIKEINQIKFEQFLFINQWQDLYDYTQSKNIKIIGDIPFFVSYDSADVWTNPNLFKLTREFESDVVAGVPPDYFSPTGQLWGNPLYDWENHRRTKYEWWIKRIQYILKMVNIIRLDHFRGFAGFWEIPAKATTAEKGKWAKGPGKPLFAAFEKTLADLPFIAEDLGLISSDVIELRNQLNLPGMKNLQFAFGENALNPFLPHNYSENCVAYTGTHDNNTAKGWFLSSPKEINNFCKKYLCTDGRNIAWDMIRAVWSSVAVFALAPMQDFLELGSEARMNYPGRVGGNWAWRIIKKSLTPTFSKKIKDLNQLYDRDNTNSKRIIEYPSINYLPD